MRCSAADAFRRSVTSAPASSIVISTTKSLVSDLRQSVRRYRLSDVFLLQFQQVSSEEVAAVIRALPDKRCALDRLYQPLNLRPSLTLLFRS